MMSFGLLDILIQTSFTIVVICCSTRFLTARRLKADFVNGADEKRPDTVPYWLPYFGHLFSLCVDPGRFLDYSSHRSSHGLWSILVSGRKFDVATSPALIEQIFGQHAPDLSFDSIRWYPLAKVFGAGERQNGTFEDGGDITQACLGANTASVPGSCRLLGDGLIVGIQEHAPNLVSFCESVVDQNLWERDACPIITTRHSSPKEQSLTVEVNLSALIRNFVGRVTIPSLIGIDITEAYPSILDDLWDLEDGSRYLALGLPRVVPLRSLTKAHIARRRLNVAMKSLHQALDRVAAGEGPGGTWRDLSDISPLLKSRNAAWRGHGTQHDLRASADLSLISSVSVTSSSIVFWMLLHIWATPGLTQKVINEINPYAKVTQPPQIFGLPEPPRLKLDQQSLVRSCPLLRACLYECIRLHSTALSVRIVEDRFSVTETVDDVSARVKPETFYFEAGTLVATPLSVHGHDERSFKSADVFKPERFLRESEDGKVMAHEGSLKPWGWGQPACFEQTLSELQVLAFVAGILSLWDVQPTDSDGWILPAQRWSSNFAMPSTDVRVRMYARKLPD